MRREVTRVFWTNCVRVEKTVVTKFKPKFYYMIHKKQLRSYRVTEFLACCRLHAQASTSQAATWKWRQNHFGPSQNQKPAYVPATIHDDASRATNWHTVSVVPDSRFPGKSAQYEGKFPEFRRENIADAKRAAFVFLRSWPARFPPIQWTLFNRRRQCYALFEHASLNYSAPMKILFWSAAILFCNRHSNGKQKSFESCFWTRTNPPLWYFMAACKPA